MPRTKKASTARSARETLEAKRTRSRRPRTTNYQEGPGPGTYRPMSFTDISMRPACGVHYREPTQKRMASSKVVTPGPGSYTPQKPFGYRAFTTNMDAFCSRNKHMIQVNVRAMNSHSPGPACYLPHYGRARRKRTRCPLSSLGRCRTATISTRAVPPQARPPTKPTLTATSPLKGESGLGGLKG